MYKIKCPGCKQPLEEMGNDISHVELFQHETIFDCIRALVRRVENLEYELMYKDLPDRLSDSSDPGPSISTPTPIIPISTPIPIIPNFEDEK